MKQFYAFVDYHEHESAVSAIQAMDGQTFKGLTLTVQQSSMFSVPGCWLFHLISDLTFRFPFRLFPIHNTLAYSPNAFCL